MRNNSAGNRNVVYRTLIRLVSLHSLIWTWQPPCSAPSTWNLFGGNSLQTQVHTNVFSHDPAMRFSWITKSTLTGISGNKSKYKWNSLLRPTEVLLLYLRRNLWKQIVYLWLASLSLSCLIFSFVSFRSSSVYSLVMFLLIGVSPTDRMRNLKSPVRSPIPKLGSPVPTPVSGLQKLPQCTRCCNGIV